MFECTTCGYQTNRSYNFNLHNNRKTPCKPKIIVLENKNNIDSNEKSDPNGKSLELIGQTCGKGCHFVFLQPD